MTGVLWTKKHGNDSTPKNRKIRIPRGAAEIYLTALDPTVGREIQKTRPALIIQNDVSNRLSGVTIVAPIHLDSPLSAPALSMCCWPPANSTGLSVTSVAVFNQIRAVDRVRLIKRLGVVDSETMEQVDEAIKISLGLLAI